MSNRFRIRKLTLFAAGVTLLAVAIVTGNRRLCSAEEGNDYQSIELFSDVLSQIKKSYVEDVDTKKLIYGAINGMLASLDPHSSFMPPEMFKEMKKESKGSFAGIGIEITIKDNMMTVISPIEDTPAFRAGIKAGDVILKIDDKYTKDMTSMEAVKRMRGANGSKVVLAIGRDGFEEPKEFQLVRELIHLKSVKYKTLDNGYGYIRIAQFQENTDDDLIKALQSLRTDNGGELRGLVLDLRNDPGGLLNQAVNVAAHFVEEGKLIVSIEGREKNSKTKFTSQNTVKEPHYPIVVLINSGSASASEIVAGALQDHKRGIIMGTRSFGKGSVQTTIPLSDKSGLTLTTALYYTPSGRSIQAKGITPDIVVEQKELAAQPKKDAMQIDIREQDLENHFEPEVGKKSPKEKTEEKLPLYQSDEQIRGDYQILRALDMLKGWETLKSVIKAD